MCGQTLRDRLAAAKRAIWVTAVASLMLTATACGAALGGITDEEPPSNQASAPIVAATSRSDPATGRDAGARDGAAMDQAYEIVSVLPRDGIPAIDDPLFVSALEADEVYADDDMVIGVSVDDDHRAYSIPFLSGHEIVNDEVGGRPITVTW